MSGSRARAIRRHRHIIARLVSWADNAAMTQHKHGRSETHITLEAPPTAMVTQAESIIHGWWLRSNVYPIRRVFHTVTP